MAALHFYLLKTRQEVLCLRQYEVLAFSNGQASRYTLKEVNASLPEKAVRDVRHAGRVLQTKLRPRARQR